MVDILEQVLLRIRLLRVTFDQRTPTLRNKVLGHGLVIRNEHGRHIFNAAYRARQLVGVPTRIVRQQRNTIVGHLLVRLGLQATILRVDREIALLIHRVHSRVIQRLIVLSQYIIIERCAEAVEDMAKNLRIAILTDHFCHIGRSHKHLIQHMQITVQANHVSFLNARIEHIGASRFRLAPAFFVVQHEGHIRALDILLAHIAFEEVRDQRTRSIGHHIDALCAAAVVTLPILLFVLIGVIVHRQLLRAPKLHRVDSLRCRLLAQTQILSSARSIAHHFEHIRIVQLRTVEEHTLLCRRELFIRTNSPRIVLEKFVVSFVARHKKRLTTRLRHNVLVTEVFNQTNGILKAARIQLIVDATPKERRLLRVQTVVLTRVRHAAYREQQESPHQGASHSTKTVFHTHDVTCCLCIFLLLLFGVGNEKSYFFHYTAQI